MSASARVVLKAPLSGRLVPLEEVPDPVFAQRIVGDGISIDPTSSTLLAPCAGRVTQLHSSGHALSLLTAEGLELLIHVGLDTVALEGKGFTPRVALGDTVRAGDTLIEFDADFVARHARSLLTQLLVTSRERVASLDVRQGDVAAGRDVVLEMVLREEAAAAAPDGRGPVSLSEPIVVPNPSGLHARPAAVLVAAARAFEADVRLVRGADEASARSVVALMSLEVAQGQSVRVRAQGPDAQAAAQALSALIAAGLGEDPHALAAATGAGAEPRRAEARQGLLAGVGAAPGLALGRLVRLKFHEAVLDLSPAEDHQGERRRLEAALSEAHGQLEALRARLTGPTQAQQAQIFAAHRELLGDPELVEAAAAGIQAGQRAAAAWQQAFVAQADRLARLSNRLLAARADDLRDVGRRVLALLAPEAARGLPELPADTILLAEELTPSDVAELDRERVLGLATTGGGASSHVAILARSLDLPAVVGLDPRALDLPDGTAVVLDGTAGTLAIAPDGESLARVRAAQSRQAGRRGRERSACLQPAVTRDGQRVHVHANLAGPEDALRALGLGAEGVGLLRSEFLFLERSEAPSEDEQEAAYSAVARAFGPARPVTLRTLDVGGDKPLRYLPVPGEANPFLGLRGLRLLLDRPDVLRPQLRACLRAGRAGQVRLMFPMVAQLGELRAAKALLADECARLDLPSLPVGIMVEVPSAALLADTFAREADFFSIGTNDLTQYTLAMDRTHPRLAAQVDGLDPAVLRLIAVTLEAARRHGKPVGVCGGLAGDAQAIPLLLGLGVDELSVSVPALPGVKARVRGLSLDECRKLAERALDQDGAAAVRALVPLPED